MKRGQIEKSSSNINVLINKTKTGYEVLQDTTHNK